METFNVRENLNLGRRDFFGAAAVTIAAAQLGVIGPATAQTAKSKLPDIKPGTNTAFGPLKQIDAGVLNVGYAEAGPADGPAVILLHGWPYDIHSFVDVAPLLASAGYRVIVPYVRGYGTTRFLSSDTFRNGQQSAVALDIIALMDALKIEKATIAGFDWGARTADIVAALWPERCKALVSVSGYLIGSQEAGKTPLPPAAEFQWWYQFYFATERGRVGYDKYRHDFREAHLAARFAEMGLRRRHVRPQRGGLRQSGSRRHRDPQLPLAARSGRRRARNTTIWRRARRRSGHHRAHDHHGRRRQRRAAPEPPAYRKNSPADTSTGSSRAASATICRRKPRKPSPKQSYRRPRLEEPTRIGPAS